MSERKSINTYEAGSESSPEHQRQDYERRERIKENLERQAELSKAEKPDESVERHKAERLAESAEKHKPKEKAPERQEKRSMPSTKRQREEAYEAIMNDARSHMTPVSRGFSKVIHNRAVESASNAIGATVARPNAILAGSFTAFVVVLLVFLIARHYGYPLSGSETIVAFAGGWLLGIIFDYLRAMITGRH
jgi:hypothetical protein